MVKRNGPLMKAVFVLMRQTIASSQLKVWCSTGMAKNTKNVETAIVLGHIVSLQPFRGWRLL